jgi:hypothetical protein
MPRQRFTGGTGRILRMRIGQHFRSFPGLTQSLFIRMKSGA